MKSMTIAEKILAKHSGRKTVLPGEIVSARYDLAMATDGTAPLAAAEFRKMGAKKVFDPKRIVFINDHFQPASSVQAAGLAKATRDFAKEQGIKLYDAGSGICHAVVMEERLILPGQLAIGADSHTITYGAVGAFSSGIGATDMAGAWALGEIWLKVPSSIRITYTGKPKPSVSAKDIALWTVKNLGDDGALYRAVEYHDKTKNKLTIAERITMCNMSAEVGAKCAIFSCDEATKKWLRKKVSTRAKTQTVQPDEYAEYEQKLEYDISSLEPQVACPSLPSNVKNVGDVAGAKIDQVFIGSCTNGYFDDLKIAAEILNGRKVAKNVRVIIIPATKNVYKKALTEGILKIFLDAGCIISPPTCGACFGGHMGLLAEGEVSFSTTNRNYPGRMGHPKSFVYLGSPATAAATAVCGEIADPRKFKIKR